MGKGDGAMDGKTNEGMKRKGANGNARTHRARVSTFPCTLTHTDARAHTRDLIVSNASGSLSQTLTAFIPV